MGFIKTLYDFINKLNKKDPPYVITDEELTLASGKWEGFMSHDNVLEETIEIYTLPERQGSKILNYTIDKQDWKIYLKVFNQSEKVYLTYETYGDTVEAEDINKLQAAADYLGDRLIAHEDNKSNPHQVTKTQVGLSDVDNVKQATKAEFDEHKGNTSNPHDVNKTQVGLSNVENFQQATKTEFNAHTNNAANPHSVTKTQVGLSSVDNVKQATKTEFDSHNSDNVRHITATERSQWNTVQNKVEQIPGKGLSAEDYTTDAKAKLANIAAEATKAEDSTINGNIKINGVETNVYIHPSGSNPHSTTKADVALGNVTNESKATMFTSPTFTGTPLAPTATVDTSTTQMATTAFVTGQAATVAPIMDGVASVGTSKRYARQDHIHPTDTSRAAASHGHIATEVLESTTRRFVTDVEKGVWNDKLAPSGDGSNVTNTFTQAATRANLSTGEKVSISLGKLMKWFSDLKIVAFTGSYTDLINTPTSLPESGGTLTGDFVIRKNNGRVIFDETDYNNGNSGIEFRTSVSQGCTLLHEVTDGDLPQGGQGIILKSSQSPSHPVHFQIDGEFYSNADKIWHSGNLDPSTYEPKNTNIQEHISATANPHVVTKSQVGLGSVANYSIASQAEAETGTTSSRYMTPLRVKQSIDQNAMPKGPITWGHLKGV